MQYTRCLAERVNNLFAVQSWLSRPRVHFWLAGLALVLLSPALGTGLLLDDYVLMLLAREDPGFLGFHGHPLFLFSFTSGQPADNRALMDAGALLPWWSDPQHQNAFFRPFSSLTHLLDFRLWPDQPWLMHLHSLLWFLALLLVVAHIYRRFSTPPVAVAMLAFALFALDDAHAMTVTWIANRNALCAATLALPALGAHHRWLTQAYKKGAYLGPLCFALGLCAGETAVAIFGYFLAYTLVLDRAPVRTRLLHIAPYVALLALWRGVFSLLNLGSFGSGAYHDPGQQPLAFIRALIDHLPVLISAELGLPLADLWFWGVPEAQLPIWILSVITVAFFAVLGHVLLADDPEARFWMVGMVLSACAVAASVPGERLLLVPGVGGAALLARLIWKLLTAPHSQRLRAAARGFATLLVLLHLLAAPLLLPLRAYAMKSLAEVVERTDRGVSSAPEIAEKTVIIINAPFDIAVSYLQVARQAQRRARPLHLYWLATASSPLSVETVDAHTLRVRPERGFLFSAAERHYRADPTSLATGAQVALSELGVTVTDVTADGRPAAAEFRLKSPLWSPRYLLLYFRDGRLHPFRPPPPGQTLLLLREDFFGTLKDQVSAQ